MRFFVWLMLLAISASLCSAAYVYGDIYQQDLQKLNQTVVRIEGDFSYQVVTEKANYSVFLPEGDYIITASSHDSQYLVYEEISVGSQDQKLDLVLKETGNDIPLYIGALLLLAAAFVWSNHYWRAKKKTHQQKPAKYVMDKDAEAVLKILDSFEGRATQKELREALKFSDSKLSLILTELENVGKIKKFKRGRANMVRKLN